MCVCVFSSGIVPGCSERDQGATGNACNSDATGKPTGNLYPRANHVQSSSIGSSKTNVASSSGKIYAIGM